MYVAQCLTKAKEMLLFIITDHLPRVLGFCVCLALYQLFLAVLLENFSSFKDDEEEATQKAQTKKHLQETKERAIKQREAMEVYKHTGTTTVTEPAMCKQSLYSMHPTDTQGLLCACSITTNAGRFIGQLGHEHDCAPRQAAPQQHHGRVGHSSCRRGEREQNAAFQAGQRQGPWSGH